jgi:protein arginine kinase activator
MEERPVECTLCKRKASILYKVLRLGKIECLQMCSACPVLQSKIGTPVGEASNGNEDLARIEKCPHCQTSLHEITVEGIAGCAKCYEIFEPFLMKQLSDTHATPVHLGKSPELFKNENITQKLDSLQSALTEALTFENYEQAAALRDQIKTLMEKLYGEEREAS